MKENTNSEIDGISRRDVVKLVYQKKEQILKTYMQYKNRSSHLLMEMLYKFYQIDKELAESQFEFKNK